MKKIFLFIVVISLLCGCDQKVDFETNQPPLQNSSLPITNDSSKLTKLTPDEIEPIEPPTLEENFTEITKTSRKRGTLEEKVACDYLKGQLQSYGYDVKIQEFDIFEISVADRAKFDFFALNPLGSEPVAKGHNVIADLNYDKNKKTVVVTAHYDSTTDSIGALDNASGTVAVLEAAKIIQNSKLDYNVRIIFFSSEEYGFFGSRSYINSLSKDELANIYGCFNVDMVGSKDCRKIMLQGAPKENNWMYSEYERINGNYEFRQSGASDNISFTQKGIPAVCFTTVDTHDDAFDVELFSAEVGNNSVLVENLQIDVGLIVNFIENLKM